MKEVQAASRSAEDGIVNSGLHFNDQLGDGATIFADGRYLARRRQDLVSERRLSLDTLVRPLVPESCRTGCLLSDLHADEEP